MLRLGRNRSPAGRNLRDGFERRRRGGGGAFLQRKIGFTDIYRVVERVLSEHEPLPGGNPEEVLEANRWAMARAEEVTER